MCLSVIGTADSLNGKKSINYLTKRMKISLKKFTLSPKSAPSFLFSHLIRFGISSAKMMTHEEQLQKALEHAKMADSIN
jgi:hypothetical protein